MTDSVNRPNDHRPSFEKVDDHQVRVVLTKSFPKSRPPKAPFLEAPGVLGVLRYAGWLLTRRRTYGAVLLTTLLMVLVELIARAVLAMLISRDGYIVNGDLTAFTTTPVLTRWVAGFMGLWTMTATVAVSIVVMVSGSVLLSWPTMGRSLSARTAAASVARRIATVLILSALAAGAVAGVAGVGVLLWPVSRWYAVPTVAVGIPMAGWLPLALPIALLARLGPIRAVLRAYGVARHRRIRTSYAVFIGLTVAAGLAILPKWLLARQISDGALSTSLVPLAEIVGSTAAVAVCGVVLAATALNQWYPPPLFAEQEPSLGRPLDLDETAERLPGPRTPDRPARSWTRIAVALTGLLPIPTLLYNAYLIGNPFGLPVVTDEVVGGGLGSGNTLHLLTGDRAVRLTAGVSHDFRLGICVDQACRTQTAYSSSQSEHSGVHGGQLGAHSLPDGSLALAAWAPDPVAIAKYTERREAGDYEITEVPRLLRVIHCSRLGCPDLDTGPVLARATSNLDDSYATSVAVAGGRLLVASLSPRPGKNPEPAAQLRLIECGAYDCGHRKTLIDMPAPTADSYYDSGILSVASGPTGRYAVARLENGNGAITMIRCGTDTCRHPRITRLVGTASSIATFRHRTESHAFDMVIPADDRPLITYRDPDTGTGTLLRCRTPDCDTADSLSLTAPGLWQHSPALALGRDGLPLVATYDRPGKRVVLIHCGDLDCHRRTSVPVGGLDRDEPGPLDLAVGQDDRPRILWTDQDPHFMESRSITEHLTVCRHPRCQS